MILTSFSFIYVNKIEEFTEPRFEHTFDYLRLKKRVGEGGGGRGEWGVGEWGAFPLKFLRFDHYLNIFDVLNDVRITKDSKVTMVDFHENGNISQT